MILYLLIIFFSVVFICISNLVLYNSVAVCLWTVIAVLEVCAVDALVAWIVHAVPEEKVNPFAPHYQVGSKERKLYEKLGVRKWKDVIPETGKYLCHFAKDKIAEPNDNVYLLKFLRETCYAEVMHLLSFFLQFLLLIIPFYRATIMVPVVCVNGFLQLLPVIVQRYNRCRMIKLYRFNEKRQKAI